MGTTSMSIEARVNPGWVGKWVVMGLLLVALGAWSVYDGLVAYPEHNQRVAKFNDLKSKNQLEEWRRIASEQGWGEEDPGKAKSDFDIAAQFVMAGICIPLGLGALAMVAVTARRSLVADDAGLRGLKGEEIPYGKITAIDRTRWESKGIALVRYERDGAGQGTVKIDAWVFRGAAAVLEAVESQTGL